MRPALFHVTLSQRFRAEPTTLFFEPDRAAVPAFVAVDLGGRAEFLVGWKRWVPTRDGAGAPPRRHPVAINADHIVVIRPAAAHEIERVMPPALAAGIHHEAAAELEEA
jgi:hypothetical protein